MTDYFSSIRLSTFSWGSWAPCLLPTPCSHLPHRVRQAHTVSRLLISGRREDVQLGRAFGWFRCVGAETQSRRHWPRRTEHTAMGAFLGLAVRDARLALLATSLPRANRAISVPRQPEHSTPQRQCLAGAIGRPAEVLPRQSLCCPFSKVSLGGTATPNLSVNRTARSCASGSLRRYAPTAAGYLKRWAS